MLLSQRELGRIVSKEPGPTLIATAGMHGNEPAGLEAARRILLRLAGGAEVRGELLVLAGNVAALRQGARYLSKDLNRAWTDAGVASARARPAGQRDSEDREQLELIEHLEAAERRARGAVHLADLHTTSAAGIPFLLFGDAPAQRAFASGFPIPIVLGLEAQIDGVLSAHQARRGCVTFAAEGGQHEDPVTVNNLEAVLWLALAKAGLITALPEVARARALLDQQRHGLPRVIQVTSRRAISAEDGFRMEPGFRNLERARRGQLLAHDRAGEIRADEDGVVIMPLYQGLGGDGYFWGREVVL